jgi:hypothetical protein
VDAPPIPASYEYVVHQLPANVAVGGKEKDSALATYLTQYVNRMAVNGWEFYRMDTMSETTPSGCLGFGGPVTSRPTPSPYRRPQ